MLCTTVKENAMMFKRLTVEEEKQFRAYAQENDPPDMNSWFIYHPVCREEWIKRGIIPQEGGEHEQAKGA